MNNSNPIVPEPNPQPLRDFEPVSTQPSDAPIQASETLYYGSTSWSDDPNLIDAYFDGPWDSTIRPTREEIRRGPPPHIRRSI